MQSDLLSCALRAHVTTRSNTSRSVAAHHSAPRRECALKKVSRHAKLPAQTLDSAEINFVKFRRGLFRNFQFFKKTGKCKKWGILVYQCNFVFFCKKTLLPPLGNSEIS
jgi:hypothetical protein